MPLRAPALALTMLFAATAVAADWPQWRGPNRDSICTETGLLQSWPKDGPPRAWVAQNLGTGFGTPSIAAGKIFGLGTRDGKDGVWALNEADGKELWFTPIDDPRGSNQNNGPSSTPTYANGKLYAVSSLGKLVCLDAADGKPVWSKSLTNDFGGSVEKWGYCESPLVDGDKLICSPGGNKAAIVALKAGTGDVIWKTDVGRVGKGSGYSSPLKATVAGVPMYIALLGQDAGFVGVHADTGKLLWSYTHDVNGTADIPTPIVKGDLVWTATGYPPAGGAALIQLVPNGPDKFTAKELKFYPSRDLMNHHGGMVLVGDYVYFGHGQNKGNPVCVEFKTGKIMWGPEPYPRGANGSAAVLYADGRLYFRYQNGKMVLIEPDPKELKVVSSFDLPEKSRRESWPHPVIANGKLYIRDQDKLHCFNVKAGVTN